MATITTTTKLESQEQIDLNTFLDHTTLTRAERMYYQRTYGKDYQMKTYNEWTQVVKFVHK